MFRIRKMRLLILMRRSQRVTKAGKDGAEEPVIGILWMLVQETGKDTIAKSILFTLSAREHGPNADSQGQKRGPSPGGQDRLGLGWTVVVVVVALAVPELIRASQPQPVKDGSMVVVT
ncbi:hypothetical protein CH63R_05169 [Colletotrichum higginsianum IMI 349063]|uniref:Uncharacterized protein n=1 Tax=Colletotrichum higginsianum (strain IMI 349063) TaxID=759273 RepID=A0A1B7YLE5_COLHI|nr:hypothetical protein CH63R_05169 [Colletotrichum higginsianum IMI 349063]OBR12873.1 hypothetical protein CH63R_05169 [Colletotrichum higginsianum IMI 349063]